jgi:hypothetical protein
MFPSKSSSLIALFRSLDYVAFFMLFKLATLPLFGIPGLCSNFLFISGCVTCLEDDCSKYSKNSERDNASTYGHTYFVSCIIFLRKTSGLTYLMCCLKSVGIFTILILLCIAISQVAGRSLGELVRKLGERVLPSIIPILSQGLKDPSASRRQVSYLNKMCLEDYFFFRKRGYPSFPLT